MEKRAHAAIAPRPSWLARWGLAAGLACVACSVAGPPEAAAATLSPQELLILGHAVAFLQPPPTGGVVAIVYTAGNPASLQDADSIKGEIGNGPQAGNVLLPVKEVDAAALANGGFVLAIAAAGTNGPSLAAAIRTARILCVTADLAAVQTGFCTMGIITSPRVEIVLNHAVAAATDITFAAAFLMMIREM